MPKSKIRFSDPYEFEGNGSAIDVFRVFDAETWIGCILRVPNDQGDVEIYASGALAQEFPSLLDRYFDSFEEAVNAVTEAHNA